MEMTKTEQKVANKLYRDAFITEMHSGMREAGAEAARKALKKLRPQLNKVFTEELKKQVIKNAPKLVTNALKDCTVYFQGND